jgi:hypothetical protein
MIDALLTLMLDWKTLPDTNEAKLARYRPLVTLAYKECKKYEKLTKVRAETCTALASNTAYWETGLNPAFQLTPLSGPGGEDCYFQIGRSAQAIPFPQWKLKHKHGTRHGVKLEKCVEDGVRILSYHLWRCHITEKKLRGPDNRAMLWKLYSEYYIPTPFCNIYRSIPGHPGLMLRRVDMAKRLLKKIG